MSQEPQCRNVLICADLHATAPILVAHEVAVLAGDFNEDGIDFSSRFSNRNMSADEIRAELVQTQEILRQFAESNNPFQIPPNCLGNYDDRVQ